jgi:hypothetical protein
VQGQPDALQPDDEDELEPATAERREEHGHGARGVGPDAEEMQLEHRVRHVELDHDEGHQEGQSPQDRGQDEGAGPAHRVAAVGLNAVDDADQQRGQPDGEGDVAQPVDLGGDAHPVVLELHIGPDRAEDAEGHRHQEHETPLHWSQQPAEDQPHEGPGDQGDPVDAHRLAPLGFGKGVGQDGARVGKEERPAGSLTDAHDDDPQGASGPREPGDREQDREEGEHGEAEVVHPGSTVDVADPAEADHQNGGDEEEPHQDPQEVRGVARSERLKLNPSEDVGQ